MTQTPLDQQEAGFAFSEENFARRYAAREIATKGDAPPTAKALPAKRSTRPHGGGNSFMRARRRRLAASAST